MMTLRMKIKEDWPILLVATVIAVFVALVLYSAFWPYSPYTLYGYRVSPNQVCMGDVSTIHVSRQIDRGSYLIIVDGEWRRVGSPDFVETPIGEYTVDSDGSREVDVRSPLLQEVPEEPGRWRFDAKLNVHGRVGILPRIQVVDEAGAEPIEVLPNSHPHCTY